MSDKKNEIHSIVVEFDTVDFKDGFKMRVRCYRDYNYIKSLGEKLKRLYRDFGKNGIYDDYVTVTFLASDNSEIDQWKYRGYGTSVEKLVALLENTFQTV